MRLVELEWIIAAIEELDLGPKQLGGPLRLVLASGLDRFQRRAGFLPGKLAFAALAIGQADDLDPIALLGVQRDGAARAPDEVARMGGDDKAGFHNEHSVSSDFIARQATRRRRARA